MGTSSYYSFIHSCWFTRKAGDVHLSAIVQNLKSSIVEEGTATIDVIYYRNLSTMWLSPNIVNLLLFY